MLILLSPAKTLDETRLDYPNTESPSLRKKTSELVTVLKEYSAQDLSSLMSISDKLAQTNYNRYQAFSSRYTATNSKAAIFAFKGDVYIGLEADSLNENDITYAQDHLRILSGLYGLLKPLDKMQPYRLEMGTSLKTSKGKNLYNFWGDDITKEINKALRSHDDKTIINLASNEYFHSVNTDKLKGDVLNIGFKEDRNGKLTFVSFNAKKARGSMSRFIIQNRIENKEDLQGFDTDGYTFHADLSSENNYLFIK